MEKKTPHYCLAVVKELAAAGKVRATKTSIEGAARMGFLFTDMVELVETLSHADFYKSMTTHHDHTVWQDVYHVPTMEGDVYLKLTVCEDVLIVSFKEL